MQWCDGYGMLVLLVGFVYLGLLYYHVAKPLLSGYFDAWIVRPVSKFLGRITQLW